MSSDSSVRRHCSLGGRTAAGRRPGGVAGRVRALVHHLAHVRDRRDTRPCRGEPERAGAAIAAALRHRGPDGEGQTRDRPGAARPHAAGDHRRRGRRPAAGLRGRRASPRSSTARSTTTSTLRAELERAGHVFATHSDSRGRRPRLRGVGPDCVDAPQRDLRVRALGRPASSGWSPRATRFGVKPLYWWTDGRRRRAGLGGRRADRRRARRAARSTRSRSTTSSRAASCPSPRTLFDGRLEAAAGLDAARVERGPTASDRRATAPAPGEPLDDASPTSWPTGCASASWTRSSAR